MAALPHNINISLTANHMGYLSMTLTIEREKIDLTRNQADALIAHLVNMRSLMDIIAERTKVPEKGK